MIGAWIKSSSNVKKAAREEEHPPDFSTKHDSLQFAVFNSSNVATPAPAFFFSSLKKKKKKKKKKKIVVRTAKVGGAA